ncbi:hypothetical protein [Fodinibius salsisoli]|uniref:CHAD domain-containing protein n=1 Tax=Fodinibius salsisoli TaxID=2820877 RepID=A0ABT3PIM3_9BACT|nr:hypothetical protein [Fodinibius salsisoli]MCW9705781.1 hypothetical protein [Fodinibius salsisoli]
MGIFSEIEEIEEQIAKISGVGNIGKVRQLEYSLQLFERNYGMLSKLLSHFIENKEKHSDLFNRINKWKTDLLFKEIAFRLHNFVASSLSLIDHSRIIYRKAFKEKDHYGVYQEKVNSDLKEDGLVQFIQKLRQMCQHYRLPHISAEWKMKNSELSLYIKTNDLLQFDGWNKRARSFIEKSGERIDLLEVVNQYFEKIKAFHTWTKREFSEIYGEEIMAVYTHTQKINEKKSDIIIEELESALKSEEGKIHYNIKFAISGALSSQEMQVLSKYEDNTKEWILKSLDLITNHIEIPKELIQRIRTECK